MISGKSSAALACGLIVVAVIVALAFGVPRPSSNGERAAPTDGKAAAAAVSTPSPVAQQAAAPTLSPATSPPAVATITQALSTVTKTASTQAAPGGPQVGVKVHGNWTIEVRQPDGSLVTRREFENALLPDGGAWVSQLLARQSTQGLWRVELMSSFTESQPCLEAGIPAACTILEPSSSGGSLFKNLVVSMPTEGTYTGKLLLQGNATAQNRGNIGFVRTSLIYCPASVVPTSCLDANQAGSSDFSMTTLTPIEVIGGQSIVVRVAISFS